VRPGEFMALMGPSGSGKTTLVSVIGGRGAAGLKVDGSILYNGAPLSRAIKRDVGYVLQDDLLFDSLTVQETLIYAARLRLPRDVSLCAPRRRLSHLAHRRACNCLSACCVLGSTVAACCQAVRAHVFCCTQAVLNCGRHDTKCARVQAG
jgi:ABC-type uncharacterized transport system YnjBCD ATPase subunit